MKSLNLFVTLVAASSGANAAILATDNFTYADGNLAGNGGWSNHSGSGSFIQVTSGQAIVDHGTGSREDLNITFTPTISGLIRYSFDFSVSDNTDISGSNRDAFAHFGNGGGGGSLNNFVASVSAAPSSGTVGTNYTLGIASSGAESVETTWGTDLVYNTTYQAQVTFNIDTGITTLSVDGGTEVSTVTPAATGLSIDAFALRQGDSTNDEVVTLDNLVIEAIPEPSSALLSGLALLGLLRRRR